MSTLSELRTTTRTTCIKIDPNSKIRDDSSMDFFVNEGYKKVQRDMNFEIPECQASTTITTTAGTQEYSKPTDFQKLGNIYYNSLELGRMTKSDSLKFRGSQSTPSDYYMYGSKFGFYPIPDSIYTIDLLYSKFLPTMTSVVDSALPSDYDEAISLFASYLAMLSVEKNDKANMCLVQYTNTINGLFGQYINDDDGVSFKTQRSNFNPRPDVIY